MRLPLALVALLAACGETQYFAPPPVVSETRIDVRANTVLVNDVSMPEYAINQEIPIQRPDGSLVTDTDRLWADLPDRALQVSLARHLNQITDAQAAIEPWPLSGFPDIEVTVTIEDMIVQANDTLLFSGSYALRDDASRRGTIDVFRFVTPVGGTSYPAIMAAHEAAWLALAEQMARQL